MGLQRETAGRGTMAVYVQIVFATTFERVFFHTTPPALSIVGTTIIMSSAIYVAVTKEDTGARKRAESLVNSAEDLSLEEGLLENQEEDPTKDSDPLDMAIKVQNGHADLDKLSS
ncbi:hypothetical protein EW026_g817 [Hermanssonia centrifuga]|uniref:EamA domain-containing protein n=1 Tax=Hermanssonia centrifuga TaxID=98765 RepID=A0A4S4KY35_9APHY|nr:hypothetical protein EW026_g817 [Hermanssonia centrifuga]